uniref:Transmembrane protein 200A n=1 Tax=Poecilia formosa TaxID=48698 RepID=A0A087Y0S9_POEFO
MTAAAGVLTGLAKLKRQDSARSQHRPVPPASQGLANPGSEGAPRKRKRRTDVVVVRGRLRLYSASGFFLFLGLIILAVGIGMATLGYWPHNKAVPTGGGNEVKMGKDSSSKRTGGALMRFLEQHLHSERMKMLGPFTMGIGIFIFICANAILHENRDRETKIIHMRDMYSTVIDIHRLRQREQRQYHHHHHRSSSSSVCVRDVGDLRSFGADTAARLASNSLLGFSSRSGSRVGSTEEEEVLLGDEEFFAGLLAPLYKDGPFYGAGLGLSQSDSMRHQWSVDGDGEKGGHHAGSIVSSSISAFTLPVIKLNNCVIDEPEMEAITAPLSSMESLVVPVASVAKASKPPGLQRSNSASSSSRCSSFSSCSLSPAPSSTSGCWLSPGAARSDFGSNSSLHMLNSHSHSKSLDLERGPSVLSVRSEQRKHPSWPRLDRSNSSRSHSGNRGSSKGYTRLEDREEQAERLLDESASPTDRRDYSKREKLLMISRSHNNLSFEKDEFNSSTLKRGSSETRF